MTGRGVSDSDMPTFPWPSRGDVPPVGDPAFDALLEGNLRPGDAAEGLRPVAEAIAALNEAPATIDLAAEASVLAVFRGGVGMPAEPTRSRPRRRPSLTSLLSAKLAAAAVAAAVTVGGVAAAAYAGALPAPIQKLAHDTLGVPSAHPSVRPAHSATPVGPDATGHAAYRLCTAYAHLKADSSARQKEVAFRNLATAAGGAGNVTAYCAGAAKPRPTLPGKSAKQPTGKPAKHLTGKPAKQPTEKPAKHPTGKPAKHPTGKPAKHRTGKPAKHYSRSHNRTASQSAH